MRPSSVREKGTAHCSSSYTAAGALRTRYSMASWSPSQSDPLTVSYICQRQSSSPILPSAAEMPPCAATVCERVGKTLVRQTVFNPFAARPKVARKPAPPAPITTTSYLCCSILYAAIVVRIPLSQRDARDRHDGDDRGNEEEEFHG